MNNSPAGPWWFTAVVAGITALATVLAGGLTTWLTLRYSNKRLAIEIRHQRDLERLKRLHDQRVAVYANVVNNARTLRSGLIDLKMIVNTASESPDTAKAAIKEISELLSKVHSDLYDDLRQVVLIGSKSVNSTLHKMLGQAYNLINLAKEGSADGLILTVSYGLTYDLYSKSHDDLIKAMREDMGVED